MCILLLVLVLVANIIVLIVVKDSEPSVRHFSALVLVRNYFRIILLEVVNYTPITDMWGIPIIDTCQYSVVYAIVY